MLIAENIWHFKRKNFSKMNQLLSFITFIVEKEKYFHRPLNFLKEQLLFFSKFGKASGMRALGKLVSFHVSLGKEIDLHSFLQKQRCRGDLWLLCSGQLIRFLWQFLSVSQHWSNPIFSSWLEWILLTVVIATGIMSHFCLLCDWTWLLSCISKVPGQIWLFPVVFSVFPNKTDPLWVSQNACLIPPMPWLNSPVFSLKLSFLRAETKTHLWFCSTWWQVVN